MQALKIISSSDANFILNVFGLFPLLYKYVLLGEAGSLEFREYDATMCKASTCWDLQSQSAIILCVRVKHEAKNSRVTVTLHPHLLHWSAVFRSHFIAIPAKVLLLSLVRRESLKSPRHNVIRGVCVCDGAGGGGRRKDGMKGRKVILE